MKLQQKVQQDFDGNYCPLTLLALAPSFLSRGPFLSSILLILSTSMEIPFLSHQIQKITKKIKSSLFGLSGDFSQKKSLRLALMVGTRTDRCRQPDSWPFSNPCAEISTSERLVGREDRTWSESRSPEASVC